MTPRIFDRLRRLTASTLSLVLLYLSAAVPAAEAGFWEERRKAVSGRGVDESPQASLARALPLGDRILNGYTPSPSTDLAPALKTASRKALPGWMTGLATPYAEVEDFSLAPGGASTGRPFVLLLQDVHNSVEAQENLSKLLASLADRYDLRVVGLEGAAGPFDHPLFRRLAPPADLLFTADFLLKNQLIGGAEHFGITAPREPLLWGVEKMSSYMANIEAYRRIVPHAAAVKSYQERLAAAVADLASKVFTPELSALEKRSSDYAAGTLDLGGFLESLSSVPGVRRERYPQTVSFLKAYALEKTIDFKKADVERARLVESLVKALSREEIEALVSVSLAHRAGRISFGDYYAHLKTLAARRGVDLDRTPALRAYIDYALSADRIRKDALLEEIPALETEAGDRLAVTAQEKEALSLARDARLLGKLFHQQFTPQDWALWRERRPALARLNDRLASFALGPTDLSFPAELSVFEGFYENAFGRNGDMLANFLEKSGNALPAASGRPAVSALVAGGFHTAGLRDLLAARGMSYAVLTPRLTRVDGADNYLEFFSRGYTPLDKMMLGRAVFMQTPRPLARDMPEGFDYRRKTALGAAAVVLLSLGVSAAVARGESLTRPQVQTQADRVDALARFAPADVESMPDGQEVVLRDGKGDLLAVDFVRGEVPAPGEESPLSFTVPTTPVAVSVSARPVREAPFSRWVSRGKRWVAAAAARAGLFLGKTGASTGAPASSDITLAAGTGDYAPRHHQDVANRAQRELLAEQYPALMSDAMEGRAKKLDSSIDERIRWIEARVGSNKIPAIPLYGLRARMKVIYEEVVRQDQRAGRVSEEKADRLIAGYKAPLAVYGLGQAYGRPVIYVDADFRDRADVLAHETYEIERWTELGWRLAVSPRDMRAFIQRHLDAPVRDVNVGGVEFKGKTARDLAEYWHRQAPAVHEFEDALEGMEEANDVTLAAGPGEGAGAAVETARLLESLAGIPGSSAARKLEENVRRGVIQSPRHIQLAELLVNENQLQLFEKWDEPGVNDDRKRAFFDQLSVLDEYYPGGLVRYLAKARELLAAAQQKKNPMAGKTIEIPAGIAFNGFDQHFDAVSRAGLKAFNKTAHFLVAGGKGERLGFDDIKVRMKMTLAGGGSTLHWFLDGLHALQTKSNQLNGEDIPVSMGIMVSNDTRAGTVADLMADSRGYSVLEYEPATRSWNTLKKGDGRGSVYLLKQGAVPAVQGFEANLMVDPKDPYKIVSKPHGHSDVHSLVYQSGLNKIWSGEGRTHAFFFQDTSTQMFNTVQAQLGVSVQEGLDFNFAAVSRAAKENIGVIARVVGGEKPFVRNIEYTMADRALQPAGDVADPQSGFSPYPGNINQLMARLDVYNDVLDKTQGGLPDYELINADPKKVQEGTRLEGNMQDISNYFPSEKVGFTTFGVKDMAFAPSKNNLKDGAGKQANHGPADTASTADAAVYKQGRRLLSQAGLEVNVEGPKAELAGVKVEEGAMVVLSPLFALLPSEAKAKVTGGSISDRSLLVVEGEDVSLRHLRLDGALYVKVAPGVKLAIENLEVVNKGAETVPLGDPRLPANDPHLAIRGYGLLVEQKTVIDIRTPGSYVVRGLNPDGTPIIETTSPLPVDAPEEAERAAARAATVKTDPPDHAETPTYRIAMNAAARLVAAGHRGVARGVADPDEIKRLKKEADDHAKNILDEEIARSGHPVVMHAFEGGIDEALSHHPGAVVNPGGAREVLHMIVDPIEGTDETATDNDGRSLKDGTLPREAAGGMMTIVNIENPALAEGVGSFHDTYSGQFFARVPESQQPYVEARVAESMDREDPASVLNLLRAVAEANGKTVDDVEVVLMDRGRDEARWESLKKIREGHPRLILTRIQNGTVAHGVRAVMEDNPSAPTGKVRILFTVGKSAEGAQNVAFASAVPGGVGVLKIYSNGLNLKADGTAADSLERRHAFSRAEREQIVRNWVKEAGEEDVRFLSDLSESAESARHPGDVAKAQSPRTHQAWEILQGHYVFTTAHFKGKVEAVFPFITDSGVFNVPGVRRLPDGRMRVHALRVRNGRASIVVEDVEMPSQSPTPPVEGGPAPSVSGPLEETASAAVRVLLPRLQSLPGSTLEKILFFSLGGEIDSARPSPLDIEVLTGLIGLRMVFMPGLAVWVYQWAENAVGPANGTPGLDPFPGVPTGTARRLAALMPAPEPLLPVFGAPEALSARSVEQEILLSHNALKWFAFYEAASLPAGLSLTRAERSFLEGSGASFETAEGLRRLLSAFRDLAARSPEEAGRQFGAHAARMMEEAGRLARAGDIPIADLQTLMATILVERERYSGEPSTPQEHGAALQALLHAVSHWRFSDKATASMDEALRPAPWSEGAAAVMPVARVQEIGEELKDPAKLDRLAQALAAALQRDEALFFTSSLPGGADEILKSLKERVELHLAVTGGLDGKPHGDASLREMTSRLFPADRENGLLTPLGLFNAGALYDRLRARRDLLKGDFNVNFSTTDLGRWDRSTLPLDLRERVQFLILDLLSGMATQVLPYTETEMKAIQTLNYQA